MRPHLSSGLRSSPADWRSRSSSDRGGAHRPDDLTTASDHHVRRQRSRAPPNALLALATRAQTEAAYGNGRAPVAPHRTSTAATPAALRALRRPQAHLCDGAPNHPPPPAVAVELRLAAGRTSSSPVAYTLHSQVASRSEAPSSSSRRQQAAGRDAEKRRGQRRHCGTSAWNHVL